MPNILIVEDEKNLNKILTDYLAHYGFTPISAQSGRDGLSEWQNNKPDLVLLDLNLPDMDGLDVARAIRKVDQTPIIMITARVEEVDRLVGLELGADDYITKPFSPRELVARVKAVLRRSPSRHLTVKVLRLGDITLDLESHETKVKGSPLTLTPAEFNLLALLASNPGRVITRAEMLQATQGSSYAGYERTIDVHIMNLRRKLKEIDPETAYIQTVFGRGYRTSF